MDRGPATSVLIRASARLFTALRAALLAAAASCGSDAPRVAAPGSDAGANDGSPEDRPVKDSASAHDTTKDDATNDGTTDAPEGSPLPEGWWSDSRTEWEDLAWATSCNYRRARNPTSVAPALAWKPCANGAAGCDISEPDAPPGHRISLALWAARADAGYSLGLLITAFSSDGNLHSSAIFYDSSGTAVLVLRGDRDRCLASPLVNRRGVCALLQQSPQTSWLACGEPETLASAPATAFDSYPQLAFHTGDIVGFWQSATANAVYDPEQKQYLRLIAADAAFGKPNGSGPYLLFTIERNGAVSAGLWRRPNEVVTIASPVGEDVADVNADDLDIVWIQGKKVDGMNRAASIWRAPLANPLGSNAALVRAVGDVGATVFSAAGRGYYAFASVPSRLDVVRIQDGRLWTIAPPSGHSLKGVTPTLVDDSIVLYTVQGADDFLPSGIVRQRIADLGSGT